MMMIITATVVDMVAMDPTGVAMDPTGVAMDPTGVAMGLTVGGVDPMVDILVMDSRAPSW